MTTTYRYSEESGYTEDFTAASDTEAEATARTMLATGSWGQENIVATLRVHAEVGAVDKDTDEVSDWMQVIHDFQPSAPTCTTEHEWDEVSVYGSGGGVKITEKCSHCDYEKVRNTWDTDSATGTVMETITYRELVSQDQR